MANTKISALPAASTPLAGTEVLPIVQGGITEQVSVANLTSGRAVATGAITSTVADNGGNTILQNGANQTGFLNFQDSDSVNAGRIKYDHSNNSMQFFANEVEQIRISSTGNATLNTGNLVIGTSGKGIDFSATTGTGTSELLADYEEGYFNPTLTCGTSGTITLDAAENTLAYTKIGRVVYISGQFAISSVSSPVGTVTMNNLPFAVASLDERSESAIFNVILGNTTLNTPVFFGLISIAGATTLVIRAKDNVGAINASPASLFAANDVWISGHYIAA